MKHNHNNNNNNNEQNRKCDCCNNPDGSCGCSENCSCKAQITELTNDLKRTRADFENYRKQIESQKQAEKKLARFATVNKILPLLDDIDRAVESYAELAPLAKSFAKTMQELGLVKIDMASGTDFNPELAEAVMAEGDGDKETVSEVLRSGYYYEGEVLRPAMVKVQKI